MIRKERRFETYSRGAELVRAIHRMWCANEGVRYRVGGQEVINARIDGLVVEYDLTLAEWHYWAQLANEVQS